VSTLPVVATELEIMAVAEIARALGISAGRVHQLIRTDETFPAPGAVLSVGKIWRTADVEAWARRHGRTFTPGP